MTVAEGVIAESGLCVWRSGPRSVLEVKTGGEFLHGRVALCWIGAERNTPAMVNGSRDDDAIARASVTARDAVWHNDLAGLADAVRQSYAVQQAEGMAALPADLPDALAWRYCGGGFGGYAVYLFAGSSQRDAACGRAKFRAIEPYVAER